MKIYRLEARQKLPISLEKAWSFFSDAGMLPEITPPWMNFKVVGALPEKMYPGMIATYRLQPILGLRVNWVTEITHVKENALFVDEQRFGPYRFWHHEHHFQEIDHGVEMTDIVHYALPLSYIGRMVHRLNVEKKLQDIFDFRRETLEGFFGSVPE
ncbi:MAG TPA: SRPBCC family protein [Bacillales bacterium]|nr:SRPBCC family protein [Bacillales bacterium]